MPEGSQVQPSKGRVVGSSDAELSCAEFIAGHSDFLDECFDAAAAERWRIHREKCASCARYDRVLRQGLGLLADLPVMEPSEYFLPRLQHRILHQYDDFSGPRRRASAGLAIVAFALAAVTAIVAWGPTLRSAAPSVELPVMEARRPAALPQSQPPAPPAFQPRLTRLGSDALAARRSLAPVPTWSRQSSRGVLSAGTTGTSRAVSGLGILPSGAASLVGESAAPGAEPLRLDAGWIFERD